MQNTPIHSSLSFALPPSSVLYSLPHITVLPKRDRGRAQAAQNAMTLAFMPGI